ncbi:MAG: hypothetical protein K2X98_05250, partial [Alphaproteobacteria bacterium]|nr:hypothetical protein [Alphaproteobacteria bacterium]
MQVGARLFEVLQIWSSYDYGRPADDYLHSALKTKRYIGGSDRRALRDLFFRLLRQHILLEEKIRVLSTTKHLCPQNNDEKYRWMLLIYLKEKGETTSLNAFNGMQYHPKALTAM